MKEITRIHLAKVAYDVELDAKKEIQKYITALEQYADDPELLADIEIRITELLAERGVTAGGVITAEDVTAVRERLGEPSEFAPEGAGDIAMGSELEGPERRVYRDVDGAVLGGVLSGIAKYIGIDPLWTRLIFIVLLLASFGAVLAVYLILWLVIPPARTAAEKLRMSGRPVTLVSIKQLGEQDSPAVNETARVLKVVLSTGTGLLLVLMAVGALVATVVVVFRIALDGGGFLSQNSWYFNSWWMNTAVALFAVSGVLFALLCSVLAFAVFRRQWTKRIGTAVIALIVAGLVIFSSGVGVSAYGSWQARDALYSSLRTTSINLPGNFSAVKTLTIEGDTDAPVTAEIQYIVSDKARWELEALPGIKPQFEIADDSQSATVKLVYMDSSKQEWERRGYVATTLRIYGPALDSVEAHGVTISYTSERLQNTLVVALRAAGFNLHGSYDKVTLTNEAGGVADLDRATIGDLTVTNPGGSVEAGVVRTLNVTLPDVCPASSVPSESSALVHVQAVAGGALTFNGTEQPAKTVSNNCGVVRIGGEVSD